MQELTLHSDPTQFYCPVTGEIILNREALTPSPALLFLYLHEVNEFEYVHESVRQKFPEHFMTGEDCENAEVLFVFLLKIYFENDPEMFLIHFGQVGRATMGFDFRMRNSDYLLPLF